MKTVKRILDMLSKTMEFDTSSKDLILNFAKQFSGYIGQIIKINWGGEWKDENEFTIKNGSTLYLQNML